jgi:hypothetical protein
MLASTLVLAAFIASVFLLFGSSSRIPAVFAAAASGVEVLMTYGKVHLAVAGLPIALLLGAVLLVAGVMAYLRVSAKTAVSAATIVVLVGAVQVLRGFKAF